MKEFFIKGLITASSLFMLTFLPSCGDKNTSSPPPPTPKGKLESALSQASSENKVPTRMILAAAWLESRLIPTKASSVYLNLNTEAKNTEKGLSLAQTAFGISAKRLGLNDAKTAELLDTQIKAYAKLLGSSVAKLNLKPDPKTPTEKFDWIWQISEIHRNGAPAASYAKNIRSVFSKELIATLNKGFIWEDPETKERIVLEPESPALKLEDFTQDAKDLLELTSTQRAEADVAQFLRLGLSNTNTQDNTPTHIKIIHCPLSFSACVELQNNKEDESLRLEAHYIIPAENSNLIDHASVQVAKHLNSVRLTDTKGITNYVKDAIVIMLTGQSGRIVKGYRKPADATWFSKTQLETMGDLVNDICVSLASMEGSKTNVNDCRKVGKGVLFQTQGVSEAFRWGDIPDFDPLIFNAYIENQGGLPSTTSISLDRKDKMYAAGDKIPVQLNFRPTVQYIELEKLVRCPDQKLVWAALQNIEVRTQNNYTFSQTLFDSGPNHDGSQFFRAKVYGEKGTLEGWDIIRLHIKDFEKDSSSQAPKECFSPKF